MVERRTYPRLLIDRDIVIFINGRDVEINGKITDISEEGMGIDISTYTGIGDLIKKKDTIRFQFIDWFSIGRSIEKTVIQSRALIVRISCVKNICHIGCIIRDKNFLKYAQKRKFSSYCQNVFAMSQKHNTG